MPAEELRRLAAKDGVNRTARRLLAIANALPRRETRPRGVKALFDNNISPLVAPVLDAWLRSDGDAAFYIKDMPCGRNAADEESIALLAASPDDEWVVFTCDKRCSATKLSGPL